MSVNPLRSNPYNISDNISVGSSGAINDKQKAAEKILSELKEIFAQAALVLSDPQLTQAQKQEKVTALLKQATQKTTELATLTDNFSDTTNFSETQERFLFTIAQRLPYFIDNFTKFKDVDSPHFIHDLDTFWGMCEASYYGIEHPCTDQQWYDLTTVATVKALSITLKFICGRQPIDLKAIKALFDQHPEAGSMLLDIARRSFPETAAELQAIVQACDLAKKNPTAATISAIEAAVNKFLEKIG